MNLGNVRGQSRPQCSAVKLREGAEPRDCDDGNNVTVLHSPTRDRGRVMQR